MKWFVNSLRKYIPSSDPEKIRLEEALKELELLPSIKEFSDNFIGFVNEKEETVQFIRREKDVWLLDIPITEDGIYSHSINEELTLAKVKDVVFLFFQGVPSKKVLDALRPS